MPLDIEAARAKGFCPDHCPVEETVRVVSGRWKSLILFHLLDEPKRFNALRRLIPKVTQRMLTQHLRELAADGLIGRTVKPTIPPQVEYALTPHGLSLIPVLEAMAQWGFEARLRGPLDGAQQAPYLESSPGARAHVPDS
ncbi:MAG: helix-turn-helix domain-containing protein [Hyphomonadaceae bacterium]|nr:helix-turn-helix domain-containing protein [Hyphomonadaceae bacterium]